jgi:acyl-CoA thioesterase II
MGRLDEDSKLVRCGDGFEAVLPVEWRFVTPSGGFLALLALRAVGERARVRTPVSLSCVFVAPADVNAPVSIVTELLKPGKRSELFRAAVTQEGRTILEAHVWTCDTREGLEHEFAEVPAVPPPLDLRPATELPPEQRRIAFPFWANFEERPYDCGWWSASRTRAPREQSWFKFVPAGSFDDAFLDAGRPLMLLDALVFPAAVGPHWGPDFFRVAASLDLHVQLHSASWPVSDWLFADVEAPVARWGRLGGRGRIWDASGRLVASGASQMVCAPSSR